MLEHARRRDLRLDSRTGRRAADGFEDVLAVILMHSQYLALDDVGMLYAPSAILLELEPLLVKVDEEERGLVPQLLVREQHVPSIGGEHLEDQ